MSKKLTLVQNPYTERTDTDETEEYDWLDRDANENKDRGNG